MKTKLSMIMTLLGLSINVAFAGNGSAGVGYTSDYLRRGALLSEEAIQASASYGFKAAGLDASVGAFTNQAVANGTADVYIIDASVSKSLSDLLALSVGLEHTELVNGVATMDVALGLDVNTVLSPSVSLYRNLDETLYTVEAGVSHDFDLDFATLSLLANYGRTETSSTTEVDYHSFGASLNRDLSENAALELSVASVDSDSIDRKTLFGIGINVKF